MQSIDGAYSVSQVHKTDIRGSIDGILKRNRINLTLLGLNCPLHYSWMDGLPVLDALVDSLDSRPSVTSD